MGVDDRHRLRGRPFRGQRHAPRLRRAHHANDLRHRVRVVVVVDLAERLGLRPASDPRSRPASPPRAWPPRPSRSAASSAGHELRLHRRGRHRIRARPTRRCGRCGGHGLLRVLGGRTRPCDRDRPFPVIFLDNRPAPATIGAGATITGAGTADDRLETLGRDRRSGPRPRAERRPAPRTAPGERRGHGGRAGRRASGNTGRHGRLGAGRAGSHFSSSIAARSPSCQPTIRPPRPSSRTAGRSDRIRPSGVSTQPVAGRASRTPDAASGVDGRHGPGSLHPAGQLATGLRRATTWIVAARAWSPAPAHRRPADRRSLGPQVDPATSLGTVQVRRAV